MKNAWFMIYHDRIHATGIGYDDDDDDDDDDLVSFVLG